MMRLDATSDYGVSCVHRPGTDHRKQRLPGSETSEAGLKVIPMQRRRTRRACTASSRKSFSRIAPQTPARSWSIRLGALRRPVGGGLSPRGTPSSPSRPNAAGTPNPLGGRSSATAPLSFPARRCQPGRHNNRLSQGHPHHLGAAFPSRTGRRGTHRGTDHGLIRFPRTCGTVRETGLGLTRRA
jgi:hypothetical protein